jgi:hypothetical protein
MAGKEVEGYKSVRDIIAEVIPVVVPSEAAPLAEDNTKAVEAAQADVPAVEAALEVTEKPAEEVAEKLVVTTKPADKTPAQKKLSRSMEIQRRAEAATRRARAEAGKLKATPAPAPAQAAVDKAQSEEATQIAAAREKLVADIRLLKNDPLEFAKKHGVTGAALAEFVRAGADPVRRSIENLEAQHKQEVAKIRQEFGEQLASIRNDVLLSQEAEAQRNFFTFVEESKAANPDAFAALASDLVYSDKDVWDVANHLLETRKDLQDNYDEDKLLEAVEVEARKDPRWRKLQTLTRQTKPTKQPQVAPKTKTNASTTEAEEIDTAPPAPKPAVAPRDANGRWLPEQPTSPFTRHEMHVEAIKRSQSFFR